MRDGDQSLHNPSLPEVPRAEVQMRRLPLQLAIRLSLQRSGN
jgi:hypothetical protein